jgi:hypothetical protein
MAARRTHLRRLRLRVVGGSTALFLALGGVVTIEVASAAPKTSHGSESSSGSDSSTGSERSTGSSSTGSDSTAGGAIRSRHTDAGSHHTSGSSHHTSGSSHHTSGSSDGDGLSSVTSSAS